MGTDQRQQILTVEQVRSWAENKSLNPVSHCPTCVQSRKGGLGRGNAVGLLEIEKNGERRQESRGEDHKIYCQKNPNSWPSSASWLCDFGQVTEPL